MAIPTTGITDAQNYVEVRMRRGARFSDMEDEIDEAPYSDDEKAALWLFAWSFVGWRRQRREARAHMALLQTAVLA